MNQFIASASSLVVVVGAMVWLLQEIRIGFRNRSPWAVRVVTTFLGLHSMGLATGEWNRDPSHRQHWVRLTGAPLLLVLIVLPMILVPISFGLLESVEILKTAYREPLGKLGFFGGFVTGLLTFGTSPMLLLGIVFGALIRRARTRAALSQDATGLALHSMLFVPALVSGLLLASLSLSTRALLQWLAPEFGITLGMHRPIRIVENGLLRLSYFIVVLMVIVHTPKWARMPEKLIAAYFTWWGIAFGLSIALGGIIGRLRQPLGPELGPFIARNAHALLWIGAYLYLLSYLWRKSEALFEAAAVPRTPNESG